MMDTDKIKEIYEESLENQPQAPDNLRKANADLHSALDNYIGELEEHMFIWAYQLGRRDAYNV